MTSVKTINADTLKAWIDKNECIVIDVRDPSEFEAERIPNTTLITLGSIQKILLPKSENKKIVLHCGIGKRSHMACEKLLLEDSSLDVYNLEGGINAWKSAGHPIIKGVKSLLSLDRQIQIIISSGILLGLILGILIHPVFFLLSAGFAMLLLYMGISGTCRVAMLMASMPWNKQKRVSTSNR